MADLFTNQPQRKRQQPNRYAGNCATCGTRVAPNQGMTWNEGGRWLVDCGRASTCPHRDQKQAPATTPAPARGALAVGDLSGILALFAKARQHLKFPAITLSIPDPAIPDDLIETIPNHYLPAIMVDTIRTSIAGAKAKQPGTMNVASYTTRVSTDWGERPLWYGRVQTDGTYEPSKITDPETTAAIAARLRKFSADPARIAGQHGRLTGRCCFCHLPLSDERSTAVGYGQKCANHYDLPWGARPASFGDAA